MRVAHRGSCASPDEIFGSHSVKSSESCKLRVAQMTEVILLVTGFSVAHDDSFDQHRSSPDTVEGDRRKYDCRADLAS